MKTKTRGTFLLLLAGALAGVGCGSGGSAGPGDSNASVSSPVPPPQPQLTIYSSAANFGDVAVGASRVMAASFANTGGAPLTLQQNSVTGAGFSTSGIGSGVTLNAGQNVILTISFAPSASGQATGAVSLTSSTSSAPISIPLTGNGIVPAHTAALNWDPSTSSVVGYNIYRNSVVDGSWVKVNSVPVPVTSYSDWDVRSGVFYFYSVKAVSTTNVESSFSIATMASVP